MTDKTEAGWGWWAGVDVEFMTIGPEDSREAVIKAAIDERMGEQQNDDQSWSLCFHVCEARQDGQKLSAYAYDLAERAIEDACERFHDSELASEHDDGAFFDVSTERVHDLQQMLSATIDAWQAKHNLVFRPFMFTESRNEEDLAIPSPEGVGCPDCSGDCSAANPPIIGCHMRAEAQGSA